MLSIVRPKIVYLPFSQAFSRSSYQCRIWFFLIFSSVTSSVLSWSLIHLQPSETFCLKSGPTRIGLKRKDINVLGVGRGGVEMEVNPGQRRVVPFVLVVTAWKSPKSDMMMMIQLIITRADIYWAFAPPQSWYKGSTITSSSFMEPSRWSHKIDCSSYSPFTVDAEAYSGHNSPKVT